MVDEFDSFYVFDFVGDELRYFGKQFFHVFFSFA